MEVWANPGDFTFCSLAAFGPGQAEDEKNGGDNELSYDELSEFLGLIGTPLTPYEGEQVGPRSACS